VRCAAGDGGLDPLLIPTVAELDEAVLVEPNPRNTPVLGGMDQRGGAGSQRPTLGKANECVPLPVELKIFRNRPGRAQVAGQERMKQGQPQLSRFESDLRLLVFVDDVIKPGLAGGPGLTGGRPPSGCRRGSRSAGP
jgi:hypothetical protein